MLSHGKPENSFIPLSAGDLLDRSVRLYRRHWRDLLMIVLWPILITYLGTISMTIGFRNFSVTRGDLRIVLYVMLLISGFGLYLCGWAVRFFVLGATSRCLYQQITQDTKLSAREVYRQVLKRFWALVGATLCIGVLIIAAIIFLYMIATLMIIIYMLISTEIIASLPIWIQAITHTIFGVIAATALLWLFLLVYERAIYIPQVLMVEDRGVFSALGRGFALSNVDVRKMGAVSLFEAINIWSMLFLMAAPLAWYGSLHGVNVGDFFGEQPLWYKVAYETITKVSEIVVAPVWLAGCIQLYFDRRVRREGLDLEVLANKYLPIGTSTIPTPMGTPHPPSPGGQSFDEAGLTVISLR